MWKTDSHEFSGRNLFCVISGFCRKVDENCTPLDCYAACSSRAVFGSPPPIPLVDGVGVLDRITGFGSIEDCSFPSVLMNVTFPIFSHLG